MKPTRPGILAVRAVNQYRRRDVLTFLGLRYYLANTAAKSDVWIKHVAIELTATRNAHSYFNAQNFKGLNEQAMPKHRSLYLPGANEALAEAALLAECAKHPDVFGNPPCVFSYELTNAKSRKGVFVPYIEGLKQRQKAIAEAIGNSPLGVVQYVDIKRFYPSVSGERAMAVWKQFCAKAGLDEKFASFGERLIEHHTQVPRNDEAGILTGPMLGHLLANILLHDLDKEFSNTLPAKYFRYVDDITLVGSVESVTDSLKIIEEKLAELGLHIHGEGTEKWLRVPASEWMAGVGDFDEALTPHSWKKLIGDLKRFLLMQKGSHGELRARLHDAGFRLPVPDYSALIYEASWLERMKELAPLKWFQRKTLAVTDVSILEQSVWLRNHHQTELEKLLAELPDARGYKRKRLVPKLRYTAGRLVYLARKDTLSNLSERLLVVPELHLHGQVMQAVATGNVDKLLALGVNAAQAAAQALSANDEVATVTLAELGEVERQSLAVLIMNGVQIQGRAGDLDAESELMRVARHGCDRELMKSRDPFLRELACLHGLAQEPRHAEMFRTAFDQDDDLVMDAIDQLQEYPSP
jgi:hypothetical protein